MDQFNRVSDFVIINRHTITVTLLPGSFLPRLPLLVAHCSLRASRSFLVPFLDPRFHPSHFSARFGLVPCKTPRFETLAPEP